MLSKTMASISRRFYGHKIPLGLQVRGVVKVSKLDENDPYHETYWTEEVEISVNASNGRNLLQSFYILAVPEGRFEEFKRLRRQMRKSWMSEFERLG
jgi:hypothetical protein